MTSFLVGVTAWASLGKFVLTVRNEQADLFVGVVFIGWKRRFGWRDIIQIRESALGFGSNEGHPARAIFLDGKTCLHFGSTIGDAQRSFLVSSLRSKLGSANV